MNVTRRIFCARVAGALMTVPGVCLLGQVASAQAGGSTSRPDVAAIDRERILAGARRAMGEAPRVGGGLTEEEALLGLTTAVPVLAAGYVLLRGTEAAEAERCAAKAMTWLRAWFVEAATRVTPALPSGEAVAGSTAPRFEGVLETVGLAEVAVGVMAIARSEAAASSADLAGVKAWFGEYGEWLMTSRMGLLAKDQKDHHGSSWLLQASAYALAAGKDAAVAELRHHFRTVTVRAQIVADGLFPHELTTSAAYRNSLFNLDLLAGATDLLSTRFETLWDFQLQDGPGMRVVIARFVPYIEHRNSWPYKADSSHFAALPCRRPSLLLAARAYSRPEYADLWKTLPAEPTDAVVLASFPIRQPLLWVSRQRT